jgi:hypothetical protein
VKVRELMAGGGEWLVPGRNEGQPPAVQARGQARPVTIAGKLSAELHPKTRASILRQAGLVGDGAPIPDPTGRGVYLERHVDAAA